MPLSTAPSRRLQNKVNSVITRPTVITPSAQFISAATPEVPGGAMARMGRGTAGLPVRMMISGPATALAGGNSVVTSDARGYPAAQPKKGSGNNTLYDLGPQNASPWPYAQVFTPGSLNSAGGWARTPAFQHGRLIAHDRHIIQNQGRTSSSANYQRTGDNPNPEKDGPPRPSWKMFNRTLSFMFGADSTRNLDNGQYHAAILVTGTDRKFPLGQQGTEWVIRYGGTPGLAAFRPYGSRKGFSAASPVPTVKATSGGQYRYGTLLQQGVPQDGPQKIYGGLPWGLHSPTLSGRQQVQPLVRSRIGQVKPVWNIRPLNSNAAGQSWSQSMVSLRGNQPVKLTNTTPIRQPGLNSRWLGN